MIVELCGSNGNGSVGLSDGSHMEEGTVATIIVIKVVVNAVGDGGGRRKKRKRKREKECDYERTVEEMRKRRRE